MTFAGTVQVYDAAPATGSTENTCPVCPGHCANGPLMVPGLVVALLTVIQRAVLVDPHEVTAATQMVPLVNEAKKRTVTFGVPCPAMICICGEAVQK